MTSDLDLAAFYRETHPRLWAFLRRTTRDPDLAEEIAQEAFVRLLASRGAALPAGERRAYLFRIARNLLRDAARRGEKARTTALDDSPEPAAPEPLAPMSRRAERALAALSEGQRKLLWLAHVEEWSHADIAPVLGLAVGSVRVLLHRARRAFREHFEREGNG